MVSILQYPSQESFSHDTLSTSLLVYPPITRALDHATLHLRAPKTRPASPSLPSPAPVGEFGNLYIAAAAPPVRLGGARPNRRSRRPNARRNAHWCRGTSGWPMRWASIRKQRIGGLAAMLEVWELCMRMSWLGGQGGT